MLAYTSSLRETFDQAKGLVTAGERQAHGRRAGETFGSGAGCNRTVFMGLLGAGGDCPAGSQFDAIDPELGPE